jgi:hypothetical protein
MGNMGDQGDRGDMGDGGNKGDLGNMVKNKKWKTKKRDMNICWPTRSQFLSMI